MENLKEYDAFGKKKCMFIHGLGGSINGQRIRILRDAGYDVNYPYINFDMEWERDKCKQVFNKLSRITTKMDVIIGTSLGGYMAYELAKNVGKPVILINPALDRDRTLLKIKHFDIEKGNKKIDIELYQGEKDVTVPPNIATEYLDRIGEDYKLVMIPEMEHRCPIPYFISIVDQSPILN